ncbi:membrane protein [Gordonia phage Archimedes]|uniref:Membrane protein n=1 Tax=Gordonia phage Archimedes TaxID=2759389 RepID=A0A7L7SKR6_9CAUD|nr:membrane protein [Gordonia phage Archimedes]QOC55758.1 membrane protein [Gordonia phage Archimedes]
MVMSWWATLLLIGYTLVGVVFAWIWYPLCWRFNRGLGVGIVARRWFSGLYALMIGAIWPVIMLAFAFNDLIAWRIRLDERSKR